LNRSRTNSAELISRLTRLARNVWWSWNPRAQAIFRELSPLAWEASNHNPVVVLAQCSQVELKARLGDKDFLTRLLPVLDDFEAYMRRKPTLPGQGATKGKPPVVAYFCAEFGFHESLPFYSGGLGVLAGDHVKSASDLGLPLVGIGLFYRQGYFQQHIDASGRQQESYPTNDPSTLPVELVREPSGKALLSSVTIGSSTVNFQAWKLDVGRSVVYLLDTDVEENAEHFRGLTALAYGGDMNTRIRQEIVLGIGGVRFLRAIGVAPAVFHMNEGHAAFLTLELLRERLQGGQSKAKGEELVRRQCVFTTHTPVAAGHDRFPTDLIEFTLHPFAELMNLSVDELMEYGQTVNARGSGEFTMTVLGLKLSRAANGVSEKHGEISRLMWADLYPKMKPAKVPIGHVTNGVHLPSWATATTWEFWERHNSHRWKEHLTDPKFWQHVSDPDIVSDEELWALRYSLRRALIEFIRQRAHNQRAFGGPNGDEALLRLLSFDALTIGYARRFAPYKRAPLLFSELSRAQMLFDDPHRPIQIVYAGKSHPRDSEGKEFLREVVSVTHQPPFFGKVIFLENYDMNVARHLVAGCDVWLNTPRRPLEASGTSGQKISINGGLHCSILDGWWNEAYDGKNGWAIGGKIEDTAPPDEVDRSDARSLYDVLANEVIPLFYERDRNGLPRKWIAKIRHAMRTIIPVYNTHRMVSEYARRYYFPPSRSRP
jgi:starch phosphorylase